MSARVRIAVTAAGFVMVGAAGILALGAAALCSPAAASTVHRAPLSRQFREWRAEAADSESSGSGALGHIPAPVDAGSLQADDETVVLRRSATSSLPASYDLRDQGGLTAVRDQGNYGTCWAFASLGSLESILLRADGATFDFSEDNMALTCGFTADGYDDGGNSLMASAYLARWTGPVLESQDAYGDSVTPSGLSPVKHVQEVVFLPKRASATDNDAIKAAVMEYGAVTTAFYWASGGYKSSTASYYRTSDPGVSNHAVAVVGWDDEYPASEFGSTPPGNGAFIVRNSWGSDWGDGGYFYVSYYDSTFARGSGWCESDNAVFTAEDTTDYDAIYQYDPFGYVYSISADGTDREVGWMANSFTATDDGSVEAVSFYTLGESTSYKVYVADTLSASSSSLLASGTLDDAGYHTVPLTSARAIGQGDTFYVIVRLDTPDCDYPIAVEGYCRDYAEYTTSSKGQSYVAGDVSGSPGAWSDIGGDPDRYNVCVKAFSSDTDPSPSPSPDPSPSPSLDPSPSPDPDTGVAPTTTAVGLSSTSSEGWTGKAVTVTLTATGGSGGTTTYYRIDDGAWTSYSSAFVVSGQGSHTVRYYSAAQLGAKESVRTGYANIDTVAPSSVAKALTVKKAQASKGRRLSMRVTVKDAEPSCGAVTLVTTVATKSGMRLGRTTTTRASGSVATVRVKLERTLRRGAYVVVTRATDVAGNAQAPAKKVRLRVR